MNKAIIPCAITSMNFISGFLAIIMGIKGSLGLALLLIMLAAFFDLIDGRIAYSLDAASEFGKELDSFADLVSFGVAPAIVLHHVLNSAHFAEPYLELIIPVIFLMCGIFRLARYNVLNIKDYFVGIPIPVAGIILTASCYYMKSSHFFLITLISLILSILMVSTIKVPRFKFNLLKR